MRQQLGCSVLISILLLQLCSAPMLSQSKNKRDYVWLHGAYSPTDLLIVDFVEAPGIFQIRSKGLEFDTNNTSISNEDGELLFYSNGCAVADSTHQIMPNGDSINGGPFFDLFWQGDCKNGYPGRQDIIILPDPYYSEGFYIIHKTVDYEENPDPNFPINSLKYSYVDMDLNSGKGDVTIKNEVIFNGDLLWSYLTAIKHSNHTDWWIVQPKNKTNTYYKLLLDSSGFIKIDSQSIGMPFDSIYAEAGGEAKFSPNGEMYAYFNLTDGLYLFDFSRFNGQLSNFKHLQFRDFRASGATSIEFSPDSKLLYLSSADSLWQIDLTADNLADGKQLIDVWNGAQDPLSTTFADALLAPDCKIYIRPRTGVRSMHVINYPNRKGKACDFQQQVISIPTFLDRGSFPNFPRFRVDEEVCDTSFTTALQELSYNRFPLKLYPDPSQSHVHISFEDRMSGQIQVFDVGLQSIIFKSEIYDTDLYTLNIDDFPQGQYFIQFIPFSNSDRVFYTGSFVKVE